MFNSGQAQYHVGANFVTTRADTYPYIDPSRFNLQGKHALITDASKGVGRATAISYAKAGASGIAIAARSSLEDVAKEVKEAAAAAGRPEPNILAIKLDVTDRGSVKAAVAEVSRAFEGRLDVLINNAGYLSSFGSILDMDPNDWWQDYEVNVKGVYNVTHSFFPMLIKSQLRILINITSIGAVSLVPGNSAYGSAKLAVMQLTEYINQDNGEGKEGVLAIAVHPGAIMTELAAKMPAEMHHRLTETLELSGDTLLWLGAERREWLSGRYVSASWDMEALSEKREEILRGDLLKVRLAVQ